MTSLEYKTTSGEGGGEEGAELKQGGRQRKVKGVRESEETKVGEYLMERCEGRAGKMRQGGGRGGEKEE